ncbi:MAG: hypothetical protein ACM3QZ_04880 [Solirubrobacterales bacterium]
MDRILVTEHSRKRLRDLRQAGIALQDVIEASRDIPGLIPVATRFRGFFARSGKVFDLVVKDTEDGRLVITVIGKN